MTEDPYKHMPAANEALRESRRELIRERITWLRNEYDEASLHTAVAAVIDVGGRYPKSGTPFLKSFDNTRVYA